MNTLTENAIPLPSQLCDVFTKPWNSNILSWSKPPYKKPRLQALLSNSVQSLGRSKSLEGWIQMPAWWYSVVSTVLCLTSRPPSFWPIPPPRGTHFQEHMAQQIVMEFPMNTHILLLSSCFGDLGCIYMVLVNAKDKARNVLLTPPSLPPILVSLIQEWARLHPSQLNALQWRWKKYKLSCQYPQKLKLSQGARMLWIPILGEIIIINNNNKWDGEMIKPDIYSCLENSKNVLSLSMNPLALRSQLQTASLYLIRGRTTGNQN